MPGVCDLAAYRISVVATLPGWRLPGGGGEESATARFPDRTATKIEQRVVLLRQQRPDWGARKLQVLLRQQEVNPAGHHHPSYFAAPPTGAATRPASHRGAAL